jgi:hypothetical protein
MLSDPGRKPCSATSRRRAAPQGTSKATAPNQKDRASRVSAAPAGKLRALAIKNKNKPCS